jgi:hypothetical protein
VAFPGSSFCSVLSNDFALCATNNILFLNLEAVAGDDVMVANNRRVSGVAGIVTITGATNATITEIDNA